MHTYTYTYTYIYIYIYIHVHTYIIDILFKIDRFKHFCNSTSFFLNVKLWKVVMKYNCSMKGIQGI